jgi:arsenite methyltransferase
MLTCVLRPSPVDLPANGLGCGMTVQKRVLVGLWRQLGRPPDLAGRVVGRMLNRGNRSAVHVAVDAAEAGTG